jgi:hypothetical protein
MPRVLITEVPGDGTDRTWRLPLTTRVTLAVWAWVMLLAAALCFGVGVYCGPLQSGNTGLPFGVREVGGVLYAVGAGMLGLALRIVRDHRRKRAGRPY